MKKRINWFWGAFQAFCAVSALSLAGCADDSLERQSGDNSGVRVSFVVSDAQMDDTSEDKALTRGVGGGLSAEDLAPRRLDVEGAPEASLVETTVEGVNPVVPSVATRGNVVTNITTNFSTIGYRSASAGFSVDGITPWFHNKEAQPNGTLVERVLWSWHQPYGRFYAVWPKVEDSDTKLRLSGASHVGTPYVDFEVAENVTDQRDLLTASSGQVHYAVQGQVPDIYLRFRHALTAVRFAVGANLSWGKTINKVEIVNTLSKGRYTLANETDSNGVWSDLSERKAFTLDGINVSTSGLVNHVLTGNTGDNYTFFMLPQTLDGNEVKAIIHFAGGGNLTATLKGSWQAGTTKTYTLSQKASDWEYVLTAESPAMLAYDATQSGLYKVTSYRQALDGTKQAVGWKVVGYDADGDDSFSMDEKPAWLTGLSLDSSDGSATGAANTGTATVSPDALVDRLAELNQGLKNATALGNATTPYNLANQTDGGNAIENTANCYMISAPGYYRLPLVYGNAVKDGTANVQSYQPTLPNSATYVLRNFKGHDGQDITTPYINEQHSSNPATQGSIVWADAAGLVSNLSVQGSGRGAFLHFEVKQAYLVNGNAVVAVKNASGTVMWNWHLWFAPKSVLNTIPVTNFQNKVYNFTADALGMKYTAWHGTSYDVPRRVKVKVEQMIANNSSKQSAIFEVVQNPLAVKKGITTLYQFGRKDAFPGTDAVAEGGFTPNAGDNMSFVNGIQNPGSFYVWGGAWFVGGAYGYNNLWSGQNTVYGFNDNPVVKTIYDPCPVGFSLPASNAFTGFTTTGGNTSSSNQFNTRNWDTGWYIYTNSSKSQTIFFPASGLRSIDDGSLYDVGGLGYYWSAVPDGALYGCCLLFRQWYVYPQYNTYRSSGFGVRPTSE